MSSRGGSSVWVAARQHALPRVLRAMLRGAAHRGGAGARRGLAAARGRGEPGGGSDQGHTLPGVDGRGGDVRAAHPPGGGRGTLRLAVPIEGCERLKNKYDGPWIALLKRGGTDPSCSFVTKVRPTRAPGSSRDTPADEDSRILRRALFSFHFLFAFLFAETRVGRIPYALKGVFSSFRLLHAPDTNETRVLSKIRCATRSTPARSPRSSTTIATPR